jgi:hypothetical protein
MIDDPVQFAQDLGNPSVPAARMEDSFIPMQDVNKEMNMMMQSVRLRELVMAHFPSFSNSAQMRPKSVWLEEGDYVSALMGSTCMPLVATLTRWHRSSDIQTLVN